MKTDHKSSPCHFVTGLSGIPSVSNSMYQTEANQSGPSYFDVA